MRVLLDANLPRALARQLTGHEARSVHAHAWSDLDDSALLDVAASAYDVLVTLDQSLPFQQNLRGRPIAVVVVRARSNRVQDLLPLVPALLDAIARCRPGEVSRAPE